MSIHKILLVLKFEFLTTIKRRSVLFALFGLPLLSIVILTVLNQLAGGGDDGTGNGATSLLENIVQGTAEVALPDGVVDHSSLISALPSDLQDYLVLLPSQEAAEAAYEAEEIRGYFVIPADYIESGDVEYFAEEDPLNHPQEQMLVTILANSLLDPQLAQRVITPSIATTVDLSRPEGEQENSFDNFGQSLFLGIGMALLFYLTVIGSAGYLLQSLGKEKENRVLEILLSSTRPLELLVGKMIGLGAVGVVQLAVWTLLVNFILGRENSFLGNIQLPDLEPRIWFLAVSFFLVGYLVYGSLFAGLGAISPGQKESSQYTFFLMLPTFLPVWLNSILISAPNQATATIMSIFPLTAPIAMPMRMVVTAVPIWQVGLSLLLAILTAVGLLAIATRFFRSQTLLSGQGLNPRRIFQAVRGGH